MEKITVGVLFGGCSPEYEVSLQSAYSVVTHADDTRFELVLLGITRSGEWFLFEGEPKCIREDTWHAVGNCVPAILSPDRLARGVLVLDGPGGKLGRLIQLDAAMPIMHGRFGEDGTLQGLLELAGVKIVGCGTLASALCMDKDRAHRIVASAGVAVPQAFTVRGEFDADEVRCRARELGYPLYVKPVRAGSSFGLTKVAGESELPNAIALAFEYDNEVIIEENIEGFEIGCAVIGNDELIVGVPDEIELNGALFDFEEKYTLKTSAIHVPARISEAQTRAAVDTAKTIYHALGCSGFARVDMFITPSGKLVFNEVNTIPGFTSHSRFPNMLKAIGMSFTQVITAVIDLAV